MGISLSAHSNKVFSEKTVFISGHGFSDDVKLTRLRDLEKDECDINQSISVKTRLGGPKHDDLNMYVNDSCI